MTRVLRAAAAAAALAAAAAVPTARAAAQPAMSVACAPIVGCGQLRFTLTAPTDFSANTLRLTLSGASGWRFLLPLGGPGTYQAEDKSGEFGGFTTLNPGGTELFINFLDTGDPANPGVPFELDAAGVGYVQVEGNGSNPDGLVVDFAGAGPRAFSGRAQFGGQVVNPPNVVPEPSTVALAGAGVAALGLWRRRRAARA